MQSERIIPPKLDSEPESVATSGMTKASDRQFVKSMILPTRKV